MNNRRRIKCRGGSALEMALLMPWFVFLFVGAYDWGNYAHALISTEAAARSAVLYSSTSWGTTQSTSANDTIICNHVLGELKVAGNLTGVTACNALPVMVSYQYKPTGSADGQPASEVTVSYRTPKLIPIPGLLTDQVTIRRVVQMRLRS